MIIVQSSITTKFYSTGIAMLTSTPAPSGTWTLNLSSTVNNYTLTCTLITYNGRYMQLQLPPGTTVNDGDYTFNITYTDTLTSALIVDKGRFRMLSKDYNIATGASIYTDATATNNAFNGS